MTLTLTLASDALTALAADTDLSPTNATDPNLNLTLWSSIVGVIAPFLVAFVNQPTWPPLVRALMTVLVSVGLGAATAAAEGRLTGVRWTTAALIVGGAAVATYQLLWKKPAVAFEAATAVGGRHRAEP